MPPNHKGTTSSFLSGPNFTCLIRVQPWTHRPIYASATCWTQEMTFNPFLHRQQHAPTCVDCEGAACSFNIISCYCYFLQSHPTIMTPHPHQMQLQKCESQKKIRLDLAFQQTFKYFTRLKYFRYYAMFNSQQCIFGINFSTASISNHKFFRTCLL